MEVMFLQRSHHKTFIEKLLQEYATTKYRPKRIRLDQGEELMRLFLTQKRKS